MHAPKTTRSWNSRRHPVRTFVQADPKHAQPTRLTTESRRVQAVRSMDGASVDRSQACAVSARSSQAVTVGSHWGAKSSSHVAQGPCCGRGSVVFPHHPWPTPRLRSASPTRNILWKPTHLAFEPQKSLGASIPRVTVMTNLQYMYKQILYTVYVHISHIAP